MANASDRSPRKTKVVQFGKYKGWDMQKVLEIDPGYARWVLRALANDARRNQADFVAYIKEHLQDRDFSQNALLKDAWYVDPRAQVLLKHELEPDLENYCLDNPTIVHCKVDDIGIDEYESKLDQDLLNRYDNGDLPDYVVTLSTGEWYLKPEIVNAGYYLHEKYKANLQTDQPHLIAGTPSKVITKYWMSGMKNLGISTGKWTLFLNKTKENTEGLTDLDIAYRLLLEKEGSIDGLTSFKVSTYRPNPNATDSQDGVAVVYCNEADRVAVLHQVASLLSPKSGKYYWKYHTSKYAKDGVKASDFCYDLNKLT